MVEEKFNTSVFFLFYLHKQNIQKAKEKAKKYG